MLRFTRTYVWASSLACLAIAVAASGAFAQDEQNQAPQKKAQQDQAPQHQAQQYEVQKQANDNQSQPQDQDRQRSDQEQQHASQQQQRDQQSSQRDEQWNRNREQYSRDRNQQWNRDQQYGQFSRGTQRSARSGNEGGLGVSIARDRREGVTVTRIYRGSLADRMGLRQGDRITRVNGRRIQSTDGFISRIRNMKPGDQVELEVRRDRNQRIFRGALQSRRQALAIRGAAPRGQVWWQEERGTRQTGYEEGDRFADAPFGPGGDVERQLSQIERQLSQLSRTIDDLRYAVRGVREQSARWGQEVTAGYDEYQYRQPAQSRSEGRRMSGRSQDEGPQLDAGREPERSPEFGNERGFDTNRRQPSPQYDEGPRFNQYDQQGGSPGGEIGEERLPSNRN